MDLIIRGGANISPVEIEAVLKSRTAVRAAAVFGIPDSALGQRVANHRLAGFINPEVISHIGLEAMTTSGPTWEFLVHAIEACEGGPAAEIPLPILLVFGLAIRLAALGLLVMTWSWS